ncbi:hypothetical protein OOZ54_12885 [Rhodopseudomonas palustris]|uniref:hypothetical protein n=1 Tax=Rhodopseudomonas palustris TaxID=1076 RepID=UPI0022F10DA0|nr:hypothetical protein [Rhodopseudomonas palustris]WBU27590.1 hypothetical protein OOZ54_12885 [Rhodopseudomonas palustris]
MSPQTKTTHKPVILNSLKSDIDKEREGDWQESPEIGPGVAFKVRSTNYPAYAVARDAASARLARKYPNASLAADHNDYEPVPEEIMAEVNGELIAEHLLLEWRGLDIPYSPDAALSALTDIAFRALRSAVTMAATRVGRYEVKFVEDTEKN